MEQRFGGKVAIVAGGSRGIGAAVSRKLGAEGAHVVVGFAGAVDKAQEVVDAVRRTGGEAIAQKADISDDAQVQKLFQLCLAEYGKVDIVVNVAGASIFKPLAEYSDEDFEKMVALNVRGAFHVLRAAAQHVSENGRILHISTGGTVTPLAAGGVYAGTKAAGERMALSLAKELGQKGIRVNTVSPGLTETEGLIMPKEALEQLKSQTPLGRLGQPEDLANAIALLLSDEGAWINGQNIQVNGGLQ